MGIFSWLWSKNFHIREIVDCGSHDVDSSNHWTISSTVRRRLWRHGRATHVAGRRTIDVSLFWFGRRHLSALSSRWRVTPSILTSWQLRDTLAVGTRPRMVHVGNVEAFGKRQTSYSNVSTWGARGGGASRGLITEILDHELILYRCPFCSFCCCCSSSSCQKV